MIELTRQGRMRISLSKLFMSSFSICLQFALASEIAKPLNDDMSSQETKCSIKYKVVLSKYPFQELIYI